MATLLILQWLNILITNQISHLNHNLTILTKRSRFRAPIICLSRKNIGIHILERIMHHFSITQSSNKPTLPLYLASSLPNSTLPIPTLTPYIPFPNLTFLYPTL
ncbi:hypothetical protein ERO13_D09G079133v2 [Gossypium hirsutum]|uniref:Uncharacterized protein n=5 Tax=Gossypium TaxID=3633 RepID=A0A0D2RSZ5_GOSRA|nr:hypothetical protein ES319_D09G089600v1 [Gossypium barbadense]KAG4129405.1 hypothetical protein ERO13_D09G079133v2 [Gossypium hirsutum]KJB34984.1 hypothetical protein B456_006G094300 [Gossypium raimondii]TYG53361.1 hypothetical protein ES288_D09G103600v1 [Gossypium darwinii]TYH53398.1 hypothetical protein ES332_D09G098200v1 [Gossypium tomentosum]TYI64525.1 hypothetical protein E1A91_D09G095300v1 [Gossypium mustelinum]